MAVGYLQIIQQLPDGTGNPVYADPGVVNANHYFVNFKIYP